MNCLRITERELREQSPTLVKLGYGSFYTALAYYFRDKKHFYTAGSNGWKSDIYDFGNVVLSVGYNPVGKSISYKIVEQYEREIQKIHDSEMPAEEKRESVKRIFDSFLDYCTKYAE